MLKFILQNYLHIQKRMRCPTTLLPPRLEVQYEYSFFFIILNQLAFSEFSNNSFLAFFWLELLFHTTNRPKTLFCWETDYLAKIHVYVNCLFCRTTCTFRKKVPPYGITAAVTRGSIRVQLFGNSKSIDYFIIFIHQLLGIILARIVVLQNKMSKNTALPRDSPFDWTKYV